MKTALLFYQGHAHGDLITTYSLSVVVGFMEIFSCLNLQFNHVHMPTLYSNIVIPPEGSASTFVS